jgi:hypothetical protein
VIFAQFMQKIAEFFLCKEDKTSYQFIDYKKYNH